MDETRAERNRRVLELNRRGATFAEIAQLVGISRSAVSGIIGRYKRNGRSKRQELFDARCDIKALRTVLTTVRHMLAGNPMADALIGVDLETTLGTAVMDVLAVTEPDEDNPLDAHDAIEVGLVGGRNLTVYSNGGLQWHGPGGTFSTSLKVVERLLTDYVEASKVVR